MRATQRIEVEDSFEERDDYGYACLEPKVVMGDGQTFFGYDVLWLALERSRAGTLPAPATQRSSVGEVIGSRQLQLSSRARCRLRPRLIPSAAA